LVIRSANSRVRQVALTFDDGPNPIYTPKILSILKEAGVQATFFLIGRNAERFPDVVRSIYEDGHDIGNHTYSRINADDLSEESVRSEIANTSSVIAGITGHSPVLFRPPGHFFCEPTFETVAESLGLRTTLCSIACPDWNWSWETQYDNRLLVWYKARRIQLSIARNVRPGSIIDLHDGSDHFDVKNWEKRAIPTLFALPEVIHHLKTKKNLNPARVSEMDLIEEPL
jgi:peptidoglycan-N-acetylglucosamine deacetylase